MRQVGGMYTLSRVASVVRAEDVRAVVDECPHSGDRAREMDR